MRKGLLTILFVAIGLFSAKAQVTTEGTEFWLGFMENNDAQSPSVLEIFITAKSEANVKLEIFTNGTTKNFTVQPGNTHSEVISVEPSNSFAASLSGNIENKAIRITADRKISVFAFNNRINSADATVVLPKNSLGNEYYAVAYYEDPPFNDQVGIDNSPSEILVVSPQDGTTIEITPSVDVVGGVSAGTTYQITMNEGDVYQLQSFDDLTGTFLRTVDDGSSECKTFAVFGGNKWTRVTGGQDCSGVVTGQAPNQTNWAGGYAGDHLFEQMYPLSSWGQDFVVTPIELRNNYVYRIIAAEANTTISIDGNSTLVLGAGEYEDFVETGVTYLSADKPISVVQYSTSVSCDNNSASGDGDPFMIVLSPIQQRLEAITFNALRASNITNYFLTIIVDRTATGNVMLNDAAVPTFRFRNINGTDLAYASLNLSGGEDYTLESEDGFIAYVYAYGGIESFGYVAGASLENLNVQINAADPYLMENVISQEACINSELTFTAEFEVKPGEQPRYNTFDWHFGDGTTATGETVTHTYDAEGVYDVTLIASDGNTSCGGDSEVIFGSVTINDIDVGEVIGPASVCPDVTGIEYAVDGPDDYTYQWLIAPLSGQITSADNTEQITVDWGAANDNAYLKLVPFNELGCPGDTITYDVRINKRLEPLPPKTDSYVEANSMLAEVCFTERMNTRFYTTPTNGSEYEWFIEGGDFVPAGANNSNEVFVDWGNAGEGKIWYREFNPSISDCEGYSDTLNIKVYDQIVAVPSVSHVLCFGQNNGAIDLTITGGKGSNYTVEWDNNMTGVGISGLRAGDYEATITDDLGCQITTVPITVTQPDELEIVDAPIILNVRCFEEANGAIMLNVQGGTTPYAFNWTGNGVNVTTSSPELKNLKAGIYAVVVTDANGCTVSSSNLEVTEPDLLEPDLESLINNPICPDASDGTAFVDAKGGSPDYQFYWNNDPNIDEQEGRSMNRGTYTVRIVDANGCETSLTIDKVERIPRIYMPNAFSPNGDNVNDEFKPVADCAVVYSIQIFNRWGSVVFASEDITRGWDGTFEGGDAPNGKYSYVIFYAGTLNGVTFEENIRGTVNLYR
ncbi:gliding motility-associated C-terminal domain-containing protein [Roseivirga pacifica]|uniref:T9SS type B sorting domain-containing protein n=1 Tax=Roseivirga pacifica TaxID=1267423 RepID=UPI00227ADD34